MNKTQEGQIDVYTVGPRNSYRRALGVAKAIVGIAFVGAATLGYYDKIGRPIQMYKAEVVEGGQNNGKIGFFGDKMKLRFVEGPLEGKEVGVVSRMGRVLTANDKVMAGVYSGRVFKKSLVDGDFIDKLISKDQQPGPTQTKRAKP